MTSAPPDDGPPRGLVLLIESSTAQGSVALFDDGVLVAEVDAPLRSRDSERLMPAVGGLLEDARVRVGDLAGIACGAGPGSFTGLRIGAAIAKGFAHVTGAPLHAVSSLMLIAATGAWRFGDGVYLAALDAMREEFYFLSVQITAGQARELDVMEILPEARVAALAASRDARVIGPAHGGVWPRAGALATCWHALGPARDLAAWEPDYGRVAEAQARWELAHGRPLAGA